MMPRRENNIGGILCESFLDIEIAHYYRSKQIDCMTETDKQVQYDANFQFTRTSTITCILRQNTRYEFLSSKGVVAERSSPSFARHSPSG